MIEPAKTIAEYNPLSFIVEGIRDPIISGARRCEALGKAVAVDRAASASLGLGAQRPALRQRLRIG